MSGGRQPDRATMISSITALVRHVATYEVFVGDPTLSLLFGAAADGIHSPFWDAAALLRWTKSSTQRFRSLGEPGHVLSDAVWSRSSDAWSQVTGRIIDDQVRREAASALLASLHDAAELVHDEMGSWELLPFTEAREKLRRWHGSAVAALESANSAGALPHQTLGDLEALVQALRHAWADDTKLAAHAKTFTALGVNVPASAATDDANELQAVRDALTYLSQFHEQHLPVTVVSWLASGNQADRTRRLLQHIAILRAALTASASAEARFAQCGNVDLTLWYRTQRSDASLSFRISRFDRAILAGGSLGRYGTLLRTRAAAVAGAIPLVCELLETGMVSAEQLPDTYEYLLARTLAQLVLQANPGLDQFSGDLHETRRAQFGALDARFIALTQQIIAQRASSAPRVRGVGWGPVKNLTEQSLIQHEIGKTRAFIAIRDMFVRAGRAIQSLKPCIMMGPQAVAQYLPIGQFHFDLVVMDEASQMRPEDALGAIARGSQLVVVGDQKQLGPASFFETNSSDDEEVEEAAAVLAAEAAQVEAPRGASVLERSESILLAAARRYPLRMLRWHYRSRYPELITFSNQEFYNNDLVLFPHPGSERAGDGINFVQVENAVYSSRANQREAQQVVEAVRIHASVCPERSLIVVTMNQPQRELIDMLIQRAERDDSSLSAFRAKHADTLEPFGVKNLENVQGDERDVVYVSVTYGPNRAGVVSQAFGPINSVGGERRLNVLFTRAKYRLDIFCSFDPTMLRVSETSPRGLCVLRDYLRFAKEKRLDTGRFTAREPDSDFEIEVARALGAHGYEAHPQVGVAGYFLDLAVIDPRRPGRYILAIECDGATYHSAKSARDRDRLRQGVLEGLGWNVHRIWSTDWFRDPGAEILKAVRKLDELSLIRPEQRLDSSMDNVFSQR
jgi:very-short-patch-repair endonuclease